MIVSTVLYLEFGEEEVSDCPEDSLARVEEFASLVLSLKRQREPTTTNNEMGRRKRMYIRWNHERARRCVEEDYWGPQAMFRDRQFERVFRITRKVADRLLQVAAHADVFFTERFDAALKRSICPKVKLLMGLKCIAYGVSPSAFQDYFQMGETTGRDCLKKLARVISSSDELRSVFLRSMTRVDARRVTELHREKHGIDGMIGSIDCMHVGWKNCPVAWQGQFSGAKGKPTLVLEAFADHNLWIWHAVFGWAGTLNDINIWDRSPLLQSFIDGSFYNDVDFEFEIFGNVFYRLWLMADGIYPELARFVKTIQEPGDGLSSYYAAWQEAARKDIERAFGVLQRKFHILIKDYELWYIADIGMIVEACIILHNMMVAERIARNEEEGSAWYEYSNNEVARAGSNGEDDDEVAGGGNDSNDNEVAGGGNDSNDDEVAGGANASDDDEVTGGGNDSDDDEVVGACNDSDDDVAAGAGNDSDDDEVVAGAGKDSGVEADSNNNDGAQDPDEEFVERRAAELNLHRQIEQTLLRDGETGNLRLDNLHMDPRFLTLRQQCAERRWGSLYDPIEHNKLRQAIISQLAANRN